MEDHQARNDSPSGRSTVSKAGEEDAGLGNALTVRSNKTLLS